MRVGGGSVRFPSSPFFPARADVKNLKKIGDFLRFVGKYLISFTIINLCKFEKDLHGDDRQDEMEEEISIQCH